VSTQLQLNNNDNTAYYEVMSCFLIENYRLLRQMLFLHLHDMGEIFYLNVCGSFGERDCLVGIATCYGLGGLGIESW
jgi:hypothetical protein